MTDERRIQVQPDGPYIVRGRIPLTRKSPVVSEHGEPMTWRKGQTVSDDETYALCRCGQSGNKPFCDGTHTEVGFDGTESAPTDDYAERADVYEGDGIVMKDDRSICEHAGFCGDRATNVWKMVKDTEDSRVRARMMAMIEHCPSGALTYALEADGEDIEPDLPVEVAVTDDGPLWVTGEVPVERADGQPLETRNRVTLCRCGASKIKPLCDGSHADIGFEG